MNKLGRNQKLRTDAEAKLAEPHEKPAEYSVADLSRLVHELQVNQIELEASNEDFRQSQLQLQESQYNYQRLYDNAPVGYLSLDYAGMITATNLTFLTMLKKDRRQVIKRGLANFIAKENHDIYITCLKAVVRTHNKQSCMVTMQGGDKSTFEALLEIVPDRERLEVTGYLVTVSDITQLKNDEIEMARLNKQLKAYAQRIMLVQEAERKRIAFELHDDTAQYLSILKMQIGALINSGEIQNPKVIQKLEYLEKDADRAFNDVRRYCHELRPSSLENMGLTAAFDQLAEDYNKMGQFQVKVVRGG